MSVLSIRCQIAPFRLFRRICARLNQPDGILLRLCAESFARNIPQPVRISQQIWGIAFLHGCHPPSIFFLDELAFDARKDVLLSRRLPCQSGLGLMSIYNKMPPSTILALIAILLSAPLISLVSGFVPYYNPGLPTRSPTPTTTPNPNATPQPFNSTLCSTPTTSGVYPQCWDILSMDTYLRTWYHNPTTTSTSSSACLPDEPWSYCFTRLADLSNLLNCSMIAAEEWCAAPIDISGGRNKIELEVWYGVYAIWGTASPTIYEGNEKILMI